MQCRPIETLQGEYILAGVFVKIQSLVVSDVVFAKKNSITLLFFFFQDSWFEGSPHFLKSYFAVFFRTLSVWIGPEPSCETPQ